MAESTVTHPSPSAVDTGRAALGSDPSPGAGPSRGAAAGPLRRSADGALLGGVCGGVASRFGLPRRVVRILTVLGVAAFGLGLLAYAATWALVPREDEERAPLARVLDDRRQLHIVLAVGTVVAAVLVTLQVLGLQEPAVVAWPLLLTAVFALCIWRGTSDAERHHLQERLDATAVVSSATSTTWRSIALRACVGGALLAVGAVLVSKVGSLRGVAIGVFAGTLAVCAGFLVLFAPWWLRTVRDLSRERHERVRAQERADMAAHLHDSVLQTLLLIQKAAGSPHDVVRLARNQERELRRWLFDPASSMRTGESFATAVKDIERDVENDYGVDVELVVVGDCELDDRVRALLAAGREAAVNAAKWSGAPRVSVFAEAGTTMVSMFVRDQGRGFDPGAVGEDRRGIACSIRERVERQGGEALVRSSPGAGTEIELRLPRQPVAP